MSEKFFNELLEELANRPTHTPFENVIIRRVINELQLRQRSILKRPK